MFKTHLHTNKVKVNRTHILIQILILTTHDTIEIHITKLLYSFIKGLTDVVKCKLGCCKLPGFKTCKTGYEK